MASARARSSGVVIFRFKGEPGTTTTGWLQRLHQGGLVGAVKIAAVGLDKGPPQERGLEGLRRLDLPDVLALQGLANLADLPLRRDASSGYPGPAAPGRRRRGAGPPRMTRRTCSGVTKGRTPSCTRTISSSSSFFKALRALIDAVLAFLAPGHQAQHLLEIIRGDDRFLAVGPDPRDAPPR